MKALSLTIYLYISLSLSSSISISFSVSLSSALVCMCVCVCLDFIIHDVYVYSHFICTINLNTMPLQLTLAINQFFFSHFQRRVLRRAKLIYWWWCCCYWCVLLCLTASELFHLNASEMIAIGWRAHHSLFPRTRTQSRKFCNIQINYHLRGLIKIAFSFLPAECVQHAIYINKTRKCS